MPYLTRIRWKIAQIHLFRSRFSILGHAPRASSRTFEYFPVIKNNKHSIKLSLSEFSPNKGCMYRPIRVNFLLAPQPYEPLYKNLLLIDPHINKKITNTRNEPRFTSIVLSPTCFPVDQSARLVDDPNKYWICSQSPKKELAYDFDLSKNLRLTLNIKTISKEKYRSSCFHWAAHHREECQ